MTDIESLTFQQALERLEQIVEDLDSGDLPLEEAISRFEQGMALKNLCAQRLAKAEARIEEYVTDEPGPHEQQDNDKEE